MRFAIVLVLLFVAAFSVTVLVLNRMAVGEPERRMDLVSESETARARVAQIVAAAGDPAATEISLGSDDLRALIMEDLVDSSAGRTLLAASSGLAVTLGADSLAVELELSTSEISVGSGAEELVSVVRLLRLTSGGLLRLGFRGVPTVRGGELAVRSDDLELMVGPLRVAAGDLESRLGLTAEEVADGLRLAVPGRALVSAHSAGDRLVLELEEVSIEAPERRTG